MRLLFVLQSLASNTLGRAYCLWLIANELGWEVACVSATPPRPTWLPLRGSDFDRKCLEPVRSEIDRLAFTTSADCIVALKPMHNSLGLAMRLARSNDKPILLDVDDADLEQFIGRTVWRNYL